MNTIARAAAGPLFVVAATLSATAEPVDIGSRRV